MSRFQKIFLASSFVLVGFGVAKFLGQPVLPKQLLPSSLAPSSSIAIHSAPPIAGQNSGIRLLPDTAVSQFSAPPTDTNFTSAELPRLAGTLSPASTIDQASGTPRTIDFSAAPMSMSDGASPHVRLRDEAPRAVGVDPQSPVAIRRLPQGGVDTPAADPYQVVGPRTNTPAVPPPIMNTGYAASTSPPSLAAPASYSAPVNAPPISQLAPPPWPGPNPALEPAEPRTHIVSDGDSLERLASRYLSDPRRGREIYDLNRDILSSPDLLPIGVELKIPDRVAVNSIDPRGFQPNTANMRPIGDVNSSSTAASTTPGVVIPRAQLAPPVMVQ